CEPARPRRWPDPRAPRHRAAAPTAGPRTTCASWRGSSAEHEALVEALLGPIADAEADQPTEIAQPLVLESAVESEFEAPEDQGGDHAHAGIEDEGLQVVRRTLGLEVEDEDLVEQVLENQANRPADQHRQFDLPRTGPQADGR